jgi:hypothetical protein
LPVLLSEFSLPFTLHNDDISEVKRCSSISFMLPILKAFLLIVTIFIPSLQCKVTGLKVATYYTHLLLNDKNLPEGCKIFHVSRSSLKG